MTYNGVSMVTGIANPVTLDGTETNPWTYSWKNLPARGARNTKLKYFVIEEQSAATEDRYTAVYTLDGNERFAAERNLNVTNKEPNALVVKKRWRDKTVRNKPIITNTTCYNPVVFKLYRKAKTATQIVNEDETDILARYGLDESNLVTGLTNVEGLSENGEITLSHDNAWTVSLKNLNDSYCYYVVETDEYLQGAGHRPAKLYRRRNK